MATNDNAMFGAMKGVQILFDKALGGQESFIEATMSLANAFRVGHLAGIQIAADIR